MIFFEKMIFFEFLAKKGKMGGFILEFFHGVRKLQFLNSVHFHFRDGVLYEEEHTRKVKFVIY